ncbi:GGDEF domain-containing protein [Alginatibacterium sediminis]|uniref:diguanylate cyclase n=2 Tax=Alginatibacterium sediminis TaxID=2164068 RepID=A0A420ELB9_9ALTE|nr:GGDEF domain-containing protein [Alginatibacterium sediminis]
MMSVQPSAEDYRNRAALVMNNILFFGSLGYTLFWGSLGFELLIVLNISFTFWYFLCFYPLSKQQTLLAKNMLFYGLILHCFAYSNFLFDKQSGMHLYAIAIIPTSFLVYSNEEGIHRISVILCAVFLLWSTELGLFPNGYYSLSTTQNTIALLIALSTIVAGSIAIMFVFDATLKNYQLGLTRISQRDALTNLQTRRVFMDKLQLRFGDTDNGPNNDYLLMLDVDDFKTVNDNYGHHIGDKMLIHISQQMSKGLKEQDLLARFGGEEFVILLCERSIEQVKQYSEQLLEALQQNPLKMESQPALKRSVSIGISEVGQNYHLSLKAADRALYNAKNNGRNRYVVV